VGLINDEGGASVSEPTAREAAQAVVTYANANLGGIDGHPIDPYVSYLGASTAELTAKDYSYAWTSGFQGLLAGMAKYAAQHSIKTFTLFAQDVAAVTVGAQSIGGPAFKSAGIALAKAWGKHAVTVNAVLPAVETPGGDRFLEFIGPEAAAAMGEQLAQRMAVAGSHGPGRLGDPVRDLGPVLVFLASAGARFITGQLLSVSGGLLMLGA
jgi:NAD(P)-dependent dehydrogenase (short-subunit alcohol dehydrogenase family)